MKREVEAIPELQLLCDSDAGIIPFVATENGGSPVLDLNVLVKKMGARGWTLFSAQNPRCLSVCVGEQHTALLQTWCADLRVAARESRETKGGQSTSVHAEAATGRATK